MGVKRILILAVTAFLIFVAGSVFSQDEVVNQNASPVMETSNTVILEPAVIETKEPETQWVYGDVINLDPQNKTILVKILDYETDQEKEITIATDEKTTFENIKSLDEIKPNDAVSVDYIIIDEGRNLAKNISLERPEAQAAPAVVEEPESQAAQSTQAAPEAQGPDNPAIAY